MNSFEQVRDIFVALCERFEIPKPPMIQEAFPEDPCDFTNAYEVRLNVKAAGETSPYYHARHVFGHYICDLHEWANMNGLPECDLVADAIAEMLRFVPDGPEVRMPGGCP